MKVLIDKTENDDKLIGMLKAEIAKLESSKGVKSSLNLGSRGAGQTKAGVGSYDNDEISKLHQKVALYSNDIKCLQVELDIKEDKIQNLQRNCIGAPDERLEENEILISEL